jgi:predicted dinucleotide-binding enzyme
MNITVIGYGNMGSGLAGIISKSGHNVTLTGKKLDKAQEVANKIGNKITVAPEAEAAENADIIISATPYNEQVNALNSVGNLDGKIVIDISNPLKPDMSGLSIGYTTSAAEEISKALPGAKVVKAFNTVLAQIFSEGTDFGGQKVQVLIAGDDQVSKEKVKSFVESLGFEGLDAGPLANARNLEPIGMQNIYFAYMAGKGTGIAPAWITRK